MAHDAKKHKKRLDDVTLQAISDIATQVHDTARKKKLPSVSLRRCRQRVWLAR